MRQVLTGLVLLMWTALLLGGAFRPEAAGAGGEPRPRVGYVAPAIDVVDLDGRPVQLSDFAGQAVFLNFWASWCPPCRMEMPEIEKLAASLPPGTTVLTVNVTVQESSPLSGPAYLAQQKYTFPAVLDLAGRTTQAYQVISLPTNLFIGPEGVVTARVNGPLTYGAMLDYLKAARR